MSALTQQLREWTETAANNEILSEQWNEAFHAAQREGRPLPKNQFRNDRRQRGFWMISVQNQQMTEHRAGALVESLIDCPGGNARANLRGTAGHLQFMNGWRVATVAEVEEWERNRAEHRAMLDNAEALLKRRRVMTVEPVAPGAPGAPATPAAPTGYSATINGIPVIVPTFEELQTLLAKHAPEPVPAGKK